MESDIIPLFNSKNIRIGSVDMHSRRTEDHANDYVLTCYDSGNREYTVSAWRIVHILNISDKSMPGRYAREE